MYWEETFQRIEEENIRVVVYSQGNSIYEKVVNIYTGKSQYTS